MIAILDARPGAKKQRMNRADSCRLSKLIGQLVAMFSLFAVSYATAAPSIESWHTSTGARVLFLESRLLPILDVAVEFPAGAGRDAPGKSGLASMTLEMMDKGAGQFDENQIAEELASVGADLSSHFDLDRSGFGLRTLSSERESTVALGLLREILSAPRFSSEILEREKARSIASYEEGLTRPGVVVAQAFNREMYGHHPYAATAWIDAKTIAGLSRDDLVDFHRRYFVTNEAVVTVVGDVSKAQAATIAEMLTQALPKSGGALPALPPVPAVEKSTQVVIPHASSQAHIRIGMPGLRRGDPDYFPLWIASQILGGGGMTSLLNEELREKRGLTYSAYSYFAPYLLPGPFVITLQTRKDQAWEALDVAMSTLEKLIAEGPSPEQLRAAKQYVIGGFALNIDSNAELVGYLAMIGFYGLPMDYLERFPAEIERVSLEQVRDALRRRLVFSKSVTVVVGPDSPP